MNVLITLLGKEFRQIFRNKILLPIIFVVPLVQMVVLVYAASLELKKIEVVFNDQDYSDASRLLISKFQGTSVFKVKGSVLDNESANDMLLEDKADLIVGIPLGFERSLLNDKTADVQLLINAINATEAGLINAYSSRLISSYSNQIRSEWFGFTSAGINSSDLSISYWYNPLLDYKIYMLSGILVLVITLIGMILTALNLVREKELGTAEQMNVTPVGKYQFILSKLIPFLILALFELTVGLIIGRLLFNLPIRGSLALLFAMATVFLTVALGIGLFISTISNTQQQVMFVAFFFLITFILMSGVFTPAESMPVWAQKINLINPLSYFMKAIRMILLKGSEFRDVSREFYSLLIYGVLILSMAIFNYRKTS